MEDLAAVECDPDEFCVDRAHLKSCVSGVVQHLIELVEAGRPRPDGAPESLHDAVSALRILLLLTQLAGSSPTSPGRFAAALSGTKTRHRSLKAICSASSLLARYDLCANQPTCCSVSESLRCGHGISRLVRPVSRRSCHC